MSINIVLSEMARHDLSSIIGRCPDPKGIKWDFERSPWNHYKLLSYLADRHRDALFLDCGTAEGYSALAMAAHAAERSNRVVTCDPVDWRAVNFDGLPVEYLNCGCNDPRVHELALQAAVILLDVDHKGEEERAFIKHLTEGGWQGILVMDDIHHCDPLRWVWEEVGQEQIRADLTDHCHNSGTGVVDFSKRLTIQEFAGEADIGPPPYGAPLVHVGERVFVGGASACDRYRLKFPLKIHLRRPGEPGDCLAILTNMAGYGDTLLQCKEDEPFANDNLRIAQARARQPGDLLIHCEDGLGRAGALAVWCKVVRGCPTVQQAVSEVMAAVWRDYPKKLPRIAAEVAAEIWSAHAEGVQ